MILSASSDLVDKPVSGYNSLEDLPEDVFIDEEEDETIGEQLQIIFLSMIQFLFQMHTMKMKMTILPANQIFFLTNLFPIQFLW